MDEYFNNDILRHIYEFFIEKDQRTLILCKQVCKQWKDNIPIIDTKRSIKQLIQNNAYIELANYRYNHKVYYYAGKFNRLNLIRSNGPINEGKAYASLFQGALAGGHERLAKLIYAARCNDIGITNENMYRIGKGGNIKILEWFKSIAELCKGVYYIGYHQRLLEGACKNGHLELIKAVVENNTYPHPSPYTWTSTLNFIKDYDVFEYIFPLSGKEIQKVLGNLIEKCNHTHYCLHRKLLDEVLSMHNVDYMQIMAKAVLAGHEDMVRKLMPYVDYLGGEFQLYKHKDTTILRLLIEKYRDNIWTEIERISSETETSIFDSLSYEAALLLIKEYPDSYSHITNFCLNNKNSPDRIKILKYLETHHINLLPMREEYYGDYILIEAFPQYFDLYKVMKHACKYRDIYVLELLTNIIGTEDEFLEDMIVEIFNDTGKHVYTAINVVLEASREDSLLQFLRNSQSS